MSQFNVRVTITPSCGHRSGKSGAGNPYTMAEAYVELPGVDFPQKFQYYCSAEHEMLPVGAYDVPLVGEIKDGRPTFNLDPRKGVRVAAAAPVAASAAPAKVS